MKSTKTQDVWIHDGRRFSRVRIDTIREGTLEVHVNDRMIAAIAFSGRHPDELAVGYLRSEGVLGERGSLLSLETTDGGRIVKIRLASPRGAKSFRFPAGRRIASGGAKSLSAPAEKKGQPISRTLICPPKRIACFMEDFLRRARLHESTGGTHAAALADAKKILVVREDIGRHNTIDMLAGYAFLHDLDCADKMVFRTGRISAEIVGKLRNMGIQLFASLSVPTSEAVRLASEAGMTLVGSVRGGRMKIYTHVERVTG